MNKDINSLKASYNLRYIINGDYKNPYRVKLDKYDWDNKEIVEESEFINGYKLVKLANEFYGYIRESDNKLMEHLFNIATDFNEYGYAMVGRNDTVTWIDKDFNYLSLKGWVEDPVYEKHDEWFNGYMYGLCSVDKFSNGDIPLSRLGQDSEMCFYIGIDGKIICFKALEDEDTIGFSASVRYGTNFDEYNHATSNGIGFSKEKYFLFGEGYYEDFDDLVKYTLKNGVIDKIEEKIKSKKIGSR